MNKRLIGGLVLLNLLNLNLHSFATEDDIEDVDVLNQLTELRTFIDENRNYTKGAKELKPVLVQYRDATAKIDGVVQCNMSFNTNALNLSICGTSVQKDGTLLKIIIKVVYEYTEYVGYTIKTAKLVANKELPLFEDIVDKNGNKRFIDGDITPETVTGITWSYAKWSLSGTHLMIVVCGQIASTNKFNGGDALFKVYLPEWVMDKITPTMNKLISYSQFIAVDTNYGSEVVSNYYDKETTYVLCGVSSDSDTFTNDANFRIQFDLLIDNTDSE